MEMGSSNDSKEEYKEISKTKFSSDSSFGLSCDSFGVKRESPADLAVAVPSKRPRDDGFSISSNTGDSNNSSQVSSSVSPCFDVDNSLDAGSDSHVTAERVWTICPGNPSRAQFNPELSPKPGTI
jgi:hypothetical protein